jgi:2-keto-3-deoxy-L-rhamnonate aldolase RhmA
VDEVVSTPDLDVVTIGPSDLALSMGIPGGWTDPRVQAEVARIMDAAKRAGRPTMVVALDHEDGRRLIEQGVQALLVVTGPLIANAARSLLQALRA